MNKSQFMRAAHKLAKAWQVKMGEGDYIVYLQLSMTAINKKTNAGFSDEKIFKELNKAVRAIDKNLPVMTYARKYNKTHGQLSFDKNYKLAAAGRKLPVGQKLGKTWISNGMSNAYITSTGYEQIAY